MVDFRRATHGWDSGGIDRFRARDVALRAGNAMANDFVELDDAQLDVVSNGLR